MKYNNDIIKSHIDKIIALSFIVILFTFALVSGIKVVNDLSESDNSSTTLADVEDLYNEDVLLKEQLVSYNGGFHRLLGQRVIRDADPSQIVIKTSDGSLTSVMWKYDVSSLSEATIDFNSYLTDKDIPFLYISAPYKILEGYTELPLGIVDYSNTITDEFSDSLQENQVDYLDLREDILADNLDWPNLFYKTDHHWQNKTAFWAFSKVGKLLADQYGFTINQSYLNLDQYNIDIYEDSFLGSEGRRVGSLYAGLDDYTFISPRFTTDYDVTINKEGGSLRTQSGDFMDAIIYAPLLDMTASISTNHYASYFGGDYPEVIIKNNNLNNGKILLIKDSFSLPFAAYLSTVVGEIHMIDLRYFKQQTVLDYIDDYQPDMVLILYNPSVLSDSQMFDFDGDE